MGRSVATQKGSAALWRAIQPGIAQHCAHSFGELGLQSVEWSQSIGGRVFQTRLVQARARLLDLAERKMAAGHLDVRRPPCRAALRGLDDRSQRSLVMAGTKLR
jgi:hypothetical protein